MRKLLLIIIIILVSSNALGKDRIFYPIEKLIDDPSTVCPCQFYEPTVKESNYGSRHPIFIMTIPYALINFGKEDIRLEPIKKFDYKCKKGAVLTSSWRKGDIIVNAKLKVGKVEIYNEATEISCLLNGTLTLKVNNKTEKVRIKGICSCDVLI
jgi:hypothetical protein